MPTPAIPTVTRTHWPATEVSRFLGVPAATIRRWGKEGRIGVRKPPNCHPQYSIDDARRVTEESTVPAQV